MFIEYLDKNGLYTSILVGPLPFSGFRWLTEEEINEMMGDHTKIRSCTVRVDLEYPKELNDLHNEYPLAVESVMVDGVRKLIPNLHDKRKSRSSALLPEERNDFEEDSRGNFVRGTGLHEKEKDFYKRMSNSVFGKTMENVRYRADIEILNGSDEGDGKKLLKRISKPNYGGSFIFENSQLVSVRMRPSTVCLNKPIQHGVSVLDRAKVPMYECHYEHMKPKYGDNIRLPYTDTD